MSTNNMPDFFDNILDDAGPIGELPDLDQVPEFIDEESNLPLSGHDEQNLHGTEKENQEADLTDKYGRPILVNPSDGGILDKLDGEVLSEGFPTFDFDTTIRERDVQDIDFESPLNEANDIAVEDEKFQGDGDKRSGDALNQADVHLNENTNNYRDPRAFADISCEDDTPLVNGAVKRKKPAGRKLKVSANGQSPSKKAHVEPVRNVMNPHASDVTASSVTNRFPAASDTNTRNSPSFHKSRGKESVGYVHLNNAPAMAERCQSLQVNIPKNSGPIIPATHTKPPGLTLASHVHLAQERSAVLPHDLLSPASPLGMLPGDVRDQLLSQARHHSYASAEMRAIMIAQEAASNMYKKSSSGDAKLKPANQDIPISSAGMQAMQPALMQPVFRLPGAHPRAAPHIPQGPKASKQSLQASLQAAQRQRQVMSNLVPVPSHTQTPQMCASSNVPRMPGVPFSRVSSTDSHAKQMLLQQHPVAMGLPGHISNSDRKVPANADSKRLISGNGLKQSFPQTAPYPIIDTKLAAVNGIPTFGPSGKRRISKEARNSEAAAQTLANTYDQVNKLSAATMHGSKASRKSQAPNREQIASSSQGMPVPQLPQKPHQQVQPQSVASTAAPSTAALITPDPTPAGLTATAVRRQLSQNRDGPRLRFSKNAEPSKYCHICGRSASTVSVAVCGNLPIGLCRKVLCEKCLLIHEPEKLEMAKTENSGWTCTHCRNCCPPKARCHQYTRNNQKRREKNDQKKKMKRRMQQQQDQQQQESKRRRASSSEQSGEQRQGISPTGVPDGAFG